MDMRADRQAWTSLAERQPHKFLIYTNAMVEGLPEPAQRYFNFTIKPGTRLWTVVEIEMFGEIGMGSKDDHKYYPMHAREILAPPFGLVWQLKSRLICGSDAASLNTSWTRFWLFGIFPVVRLNGKDHYRSAFGRVVAEGAFWVPASLLPSEYVSWRDIDVDRACAVVTIGELKQEVIIRVDPQGAPIEVLIQRWSNENPEKEFREQPFGGYLSAFKEFSGYKLPTRVVGGNHFGTPEYFPFFQAEVKEISFP